MTAPVVIPHAVILERFGTVRAFAKRMNVHNNTAHNWVGSRGRDPRYLWLPRWYRLAVEQLEADVGQLALKRPPKLKLKPRAAE